MRPHHRRSPVASGLATAGRVRARRWWRGIPLVLAVLGAGCAHLPGGSDDNALPAGVGWKMVFEKVEPSYLVAVDRTECVVSAKRYADVEVGDNVFCAWGRGGLAGDRFDHGGADIESRGLPGVMREVPGGADGAGRILPGN